MWRQLECTDSLNVHWLHDLHMISMQGSLLMCAFSVSALRVPRAVTRLTVYRAPYIYESTFFLHFLFDLNMKKKIYIDLTGPPADETNLNDFIVFWLWFVSFFWLWFVGVVFIMVFVLCLIFFFLCACSLVGNLVSSLVRKLFCCFLFLFACIHESLSKNYHKLKRVFYPGI